MSTVGIHALAGVQTYAVERAVEMRDAVLALLPEMDVLVMAAAVADYEPAAAATQKIKKSGGALRIDLAETPDIISEVARDRGAAPKPIVVGFAAETESLLDHARDKLSRKAMNIIVANDVTLEGSGFGSDENKVVILTANGQVVDLPLMPKIEVAHRIWDIVLEQSDIHEQ